MLENLPLDVIIHIESFVYPIDFKQTCIEFRVYIYDLEIIGAQSLWRYRPYWEDYQSYWGAREYMCNILNRYIDILAFRMSNSSLYSLPNDGKQFLECLDNEAIKFTYDSASIFRPIIQTLLANRSKKD